jgi:hypothetical protein
VQQALEAWDRSRQWPFPTRPDKEFDALRAALRADLAQPERKPLTGEALERMYEDYTTHGDIIRAIEKAHGIE